MKGAGGFIGTFGLLANVSAAIVAFIGFPEAYGASWAWLSKEVVAQYGPNVQHMAPWIWSALVVVFLFAATRAALLLFVSASGLLVALRMILRNRRD